MATYKVIQDIESEDKLVGPLSLRQFIYAAIALISAYLGFLLTTKGAAFMLVVFAPITLLFGFLAFPWKGEQPTEVWALAKLRFLIKPRIRIWNQSGIHEYVIINARKKRAVQNIRNMSETEVRSRLKALADTIDSRGWAVKNANMDDLRQPDPLLELASSDRLVGVDELPQPVGPVIPDAIPNNDMLADNTAVSRNLDNMMAQSAQERRQRLMNEMSHEAQQLSAADIPREALPAAAPAVPAAPAPVPTAAQTTSSPQWFTDTTSSPALSTPAPTVVTPGSSNDTPAAIPAAIPTADETALAEELKEHNQTAQQASYGHLRTVQPLSPQHQIAAVDTDTVSPAATGQPPVTAAPDPAILEYAINDDLDVATIARQVNKEVRKSPDEVEIRLH